MTYRVRVIVLRSLLLGVIALTVVLGANTVGAMIAKVEAQSLRAETASVPTVTIPPPSIPTLEDLPNPFNDQSQWLPPDRPTLAAVGCHEYAPAHPTNYDMRVAVDAGGNPVHNDPIVVLHETVGSASSAINTFQTAHYQDNDQVSYHSLIKRDGTIVCIVPPEMRAFGAGNSVFNGPNGPETVRTNAAFPASVNNFAYHTSLESPSDGRGNGRRHSGYTEAQYQSLAWLIAQTGVPDYRVTTHRDVDRSGNRLDPRSFDTQRFMALLHHYSGRG